MEIGRNDPCPCGSGKKYKKCCLGKETETIRDELLIRRNTPSDDKWETEIGPLLADFGNGWDKDDDSGDVDRDYDNYDGPEDFEDDFQDEKEILPVEKREFDDPRYYKQISDDELPEISAEDDKLIDDWYEVYNELEDPTHLMKHLTGFISEHPNLVENAVLHQEVLFELGAGYLKINRYDEFIQFLLEFRSKFYESYLKIFGYYDYDIIVWLISKGRTDEVPPYLENFKKYPVDFVDKLFGLLDFLYATNNSELAYPLVSEVYPCVFYSDEVFGGGSIVSPIIIDHYSKILHPDYTDDEINQLVKNMKEIKVDLSDQYYNSEFWKLMFGNILKPFSKWEESVPRKKAAFHRLHNEMRNNYSRFLKEKTSISWVTANFFTEKLAEYFHKWIEDSQKPHKVLFDFSENTMDKTIAGLIGKMMWIDFTSYVGHFNAIFYFADYLFVCGNISEIERDKIQTDCTRLYNKPLESLKRQYTEAKAFKQFPLWGSIQY